MRYLWSNVLTSKLERSRIEVVVFVLHTYTVGTILTLGVVPESADGPPMSGTPTLNQAPSGRESETRKCNYRYLSLQQY